MQQENQENHPPECDLPDFAWSASLCTILFSLHRESPIVIKLGLCGMWGTRSKWRGILQNFSTKKNSCHQKEAHLHSTDEETGVQGGPETYLRHHSVHGSADHQSPTSQSPRPKALGTGKHLHSPWLCLPGGQGMEAVITEISWSYPHRIWCQEQQCCSEGFSRGWN